MSGRDLFRMGEAGQRSPGGPGRGPNYTKLAFSLPLLNAAIESDVVLFRKPDPALFEKNHHKQSSKNKRQGQDFARFIRDAAAQQNARAIAIQGYEPLIPTSLAYTQAILAAARRLAIPASLVTNGVELKSAVPLLKTVAPAMIAISLDSPLAAQHDRLRGLNGAWLATVESIRHAVDQLSGETRLAVVSVLLPSSIRGTG